jgi:glycosyltransferase involved in cell wall biosynthesis
VKIIVIFDNFGPYHFARLQAAARVCELMAVEVAASSAEYAWDRRNPSGGEPAGNGESAGARKLRFVTLLEQGTSREVQQPELVRKLNLALDDFRPQVVFVPGWSCRAALAALAWCGRRQVPAVSMSESTAGDASRVWWKEQVKRKLLGLCSAALVGGTPHKDYVVQLGVPADRVFAGYDAVDNAFFSTREGEIRTQEVESRTKHGLPEKYFLASNRFIGKKNLPRLIKAYARYRELSRLPKLQNPEKPPWDLVLLGDGALRSELCHLISKLSLQHCVHLPGFKQYPDLPAYYGLAGAFIHASTSEQWGLVVNEAMASGLPVLVSNRCGCAPDLVQAGVNGFTFDPHDVEQMAQLMLRIGCMDQRAGSGAVGAGQGDSLREMGCASRKIISAWGPERFAQGVTAAAECALGVGPVEPTWLQRMILKVLLWK